jgi:hypothetical protein
MPDTRLLLRLVSKGCRRIQPSRICMVLLPQARTPISSLQQPAQHLAAIITPWVDSLAGRLKNSDCAPSMTDSSTSEGWLRNTNFIEDGKDPIQATIRLEVARLHASHDLTHGVREYSQWFRGSENPVADVISRDNDCSDEELTNILCTHCPSKLPQHFKLFLYSKR